MSPSEPKFEKKHLYEIAFWAARHEEEGPGAFMKERCWEGVHTRYIQALDILKDYFRDKIVMDLGCGPRGSLCLFEARRKIGLDSLAEVYLELFKISEQPMEYLQGFAENIPLPSDSVDVVVSVNSLDHVDNLRYAIAQVHRVLCEWGEFRVNFNLMHAPTTCEPYQLTEKELLLILGDTFRNVKVLKRFPKDDGVPFPRVLVTCRK